MTDNLYRRSITVLPSLTKAVQSFHAVPECMEMHLSEGVAKVFEQILGNPPAIEREKILGISLPMNPVQLAPEYVLARIDRSMDPYKASMITVGLDDTHFFDFIKTLRAMTTYARITGAMINYQTIQKKEEKDVDPADYY